MYERERDEEDVSGLCVCCLLWTLTRCRGCGVALHKSCGQDGQDGLCGVCARAANFYQQGRWSRGLQPLQVGQGEQEHRPLVLLDQNRTLELTSVAVDAV